MHNENNMALGIKLPVIIIDSIKPNKKTSIQPYSGFDSKKSWILSNDMFNYFFLAKNFPTAFKLSSEPNNFFIAVASNDLAIAISSCIKDFNIAFVSIIELSDCSFNAWAYLFASAKKSSPTYFAKPNS